MSNPYYNVSGSPSTGSAGSSSTMRAEFVAIAAAFALLPVFAGNSLKIVGINTGETALTAVATTGTGSVVLATSPTITSPTLATPVINSAAHVGGTWIADATWTLPAFTLGGTVSGGGNQINNVIIGTSTPLAGTFTSLTCTGNLTAGDNVADAHTFTGDVAITDNSDFGLRVNRSSGGDVISIGTGTAGVGGHIQSADAGVATYAPFSVFASSVVLGYGASSAAGITLDSSGNTTLAGTLTVSGTTVNMVASGTTLTVGVGADNGTVSAGVFTDRTKYYEGDALAELCAVTGANGQIDHESLPTFVKAQITRDVMADVVKDVEEEVDGEVVVKQVTVQEKRGERVDTERDLGAMISMLNVAIKQLKDMNLLLLERIVELEKR